MSSNDRKHSAGSQTQQQKLNSVGQTQSEEQSSPNPSDEDNKKGQTSDTEPSPEVESDNQASDADVNVGSDTSQCNTTRENEHSDDGDDEIAYTEYDVSGSSDLVISTIKDQADNIEKSWREAISNCVDSPNSSVCWFWWNQKRTIITDDGDGITLTKEQERKLVTCMGESTKDALDDDTIGVFGIGKGQYYAKGRVTIITNGEAIHFNINEWGIKDGAKRCSVSDAVEFTAQFDSDWSQHVAEGIEKHKGGFTVVISHYEDETPENEWEWEDHVDDLIDRFKYSGNITDVDIYINDELISDEDPMGVVSGDSNRVDTGTLTGDTIGTVHYAVEHSTTGDITVYSHGVKVRTLNESAFNGVIVTEQNLDLNFARNEIKSGCEIWREVKDELEDIKLGICESMQTTSLCRAAREYVSKRMFSEDEVFTEWYDEPILEGTGASQHSVKEVEDNGRVGFASHDDSAADDVSEATNDIVLKQTDAAVRKFKQNRSDKVQVFDVTERARELGILENKEELDFDELTPRQKNKLGIAQTLADRLSIHRTIKYGSCETANAWTDGWDYIVITDSAAPGDKWIEYVPELYRIICHEACHTTSTVDNEPSHGRSFNKKFRTKIEDNWSVLSELMIEIDELGIRDFRAEEYRQI